MNAPPTSQQRQRGQAAVFSLSKQPSRRTNPLVTETFPPCNCPQPSTTQQRLCYAASLLSCPDPATSAVFALGFYQTTDGGLSQNISRTPHRPMEGLAKFLLKLQGSAIGLVFNSYISLAIQPSQISDFLIIFSYFLLCFSNTFFTCLDNLRYTFLGLNHLQMSPCLTLLLKKISQK